MRLININTLRLEEFHEDGAPAYAILSHTWGKDSEEISVRDLDDGNLNEPDAASPPLGSVKLHGCCRQAKEDGIGYVWIDTCCIDKTNSVELSESINSMFRWYEQAKVCYAYLSDVPKGDDPREST